MLISTIASFFIFENPWDYGSFSFLQVVLMVYEDSRSDIDEKDRFHIELLFSPGLYPCFLTEKEKIYENRLK